MVREGEDTVAFEVVAAVILGSGGGVEWETSLGVEEELSGERSEVIVQTTEGDRGGHVAAG